MSEFEDLENPCFKEKDLDYILNDTILDYNNFTGINSGAISGTADSIATGAQGSGIGHYSSFYGPQGSSGSIYNPYSYSYGANGPSGSSSITFTSSSLSPDFKVTGDAEFEGDVKIKGVSITELFSSIEKRLSILVPDPKKLEHFEALKKAYEQYKTLEALCELPTEDKEK